MSSRKYYQVVDLFFKKLHDEDRLYFFKGKTFNPIKVLTILKNFPNLDVKDEDLLLFYSQNKTVEDLFFVLTSKYFHFKNEKIALQTIAISESTLADIPKNHFSLIKQLHTDLLLTYKDEQKDLAYFTNRFKEFVNKKESEDIEFDIDYEFLQILKGEGDKIEKIAEDLNSDKQFTNTINTIVNKGEDAMEFNAAHIILQDIIKVFNLLYPLRDIKNEIADAKNKFTLAYLFEKLQGKDIIASISIERINTFVKSLKFNENIKVIQEASLFDLGSDYEHEFFLPSILKRLAHSHFANSSAFLYRIASLLAKADGKITPEETKVLKQIQDKLSHPKQNIEGVKQSEIDPNETLEDVMGELDELIGLEDIKNAIQELSNFLKIQKIREDTGLKNVTNSLHSVFMGPPGTGKTTVARLVSKIFKHLGYLEKGHLVETDRTGMVAGYVGQTALKVDEIVKAATQGVLFIDEAYTLAKGTKKDFGNEAIEVLLKKMEDHRDELVVIAAGYPDEMKSFITSNPGLQSRFNRYFTFDHYKPQELLAIFELFCNKNDFILHGDAKEKLQFIFDKLYENRHKSFGNARTARNLFEKIIEYQSNRLVQIAPLTEELLKTITEEDIPPINQTVETYLQFQKDEIEEM